MFLTARKWVYLSHFSLILSEKIAGYYIRRLKPCWPDVGAESGIAKISGLGRPSRQIVG